MRRERVIQAGTCHHLVARGAKGESKGSRRYDKESILWQSTAAVKSVGSSFEVKGYCIMVHQKLRWIVLCALAMTIALSFAVQMGCCSLSASRRENIALRDHSDKLAHAVALANEFLRSNHTNVVEDYEEIKIIHIKDRKRFVFVLRENDESEFKTKDGRSFRAHWGPYGVIVDYDKEQHSCFFLPQG